MSHACRRLSGVPAAVGAVAVALAGAQAALAGTLSFTDASVGAGVAVFHDTTATAFSHANYTAGGTVGDFNNDGWQDLYEISGGDLSIPDRLFINNGNGTFTNQSAAWGITTAHRGKGASVGDFNGDGWMDLYVTSAGPVPGVAAPGHHKLYRNNGNGTFTNIAASAGVNFTTTTVEDGFGSTWADYDRDGDLDLFVAGFANNNAGNKLFRNNGNETFTDVTAASEMFDATPIQMRSFTPRFIDVDGDLWLDLYLVSDFGTSRYFKNNGDGTFTDASVESNCCQEENGMGGNVGDFNADGKIDWYVTSIYLTNIGWTGNKLYYNASTPGNHSFHENAALKGVDVGGYGWGSVCVDFNHDARQDIAETNGDSQNGSVFDDEQSYLFIQNALGSFDEMAVAAGFEHYGRGRGMLNFDYDNDGDQDVVIFAYNERVYLFRNDLSGTDINWLRVFLDTSETPEFAPNGHGSLVRVTTGALTQTRPMTSGDNFESHSELSAHFGLGAATTVDALTVQWPDGTTTVLEDVAANQTIVVSSGPQTTPCPGDFDGTDDIGFGDLTTLLINWGDCEPECPWDLDESGDVGFGDLTLLLIDWGPCPVG